MLDLCISYNAFYIFRQSVNRKFRDVFYDEANGF